MDYATLKAGLDIFKDNSANFDNATCINLRTGEILRAKAGKETNPKGERKELKAIKKAKK